MGQLRGLGQVIHYLRPCCVSLSCMGPQRWLLFVWSCPQRSLAQPHGHGFHPQILSLLCIRPNPQLQATPRSLRGCLGALEQGRSLIPGGISGWLRVPAAGGMEKAPGHVLVSKMSSPECSTRQLHTDTGCGEDSWNSLCWEKEH